MKKNILPKIIAAFVIVILGFSILTMIATKKPEPVQQKNAIDPESLYDEDIAELESFSEDLLLYEQDPVLYAEMDETFDDIKN